MALGEKVARRALDDAGVAARDVDVFVTVSCTGYMMPSLEARLAPRLGTSAGRPPRAADGARLLGGRRVPGSRAPTSSGAAARATRSSSRWSSARSACRRPTSTMMDVVGALLFGDGAAAAVVSADGARGLEIVGSRSVLWPDSLDELGMH